MPVNKSAKLTSKLGVHLEDAVDVFELVKKELVVNTRSSTKLGVHLEDALSVFEILKKELDTIKSSASSSKAGTDITDDMFDQLNAQRADLKALELKLLADQGELNINRKKWEAEKAKLEADRVLLEDEKTQLRLAQLKLEAAQSQLEDAKLNLESAQAKLEEARGQLETARRHLEAAKTETDITNTKLAAAKESLDAAKIRFEDATKQLKDAKSKFEAAKIQLEAATSATATATCAQLEEENVKLRIQVGQLQSEISKGQKTISGLENDKQKLEADLKESRERIQPVETENSKLKNEVKERKAELEQVKHENKTLRGKVKIFAGKFSGVKSKNPEVFFDMSLRGVSIGRIVFELFADTMPVRAEHFRALCTGEDGVSKTGKPFHYKGMSIIYVCYDRKMDGGDDKPGKIDQAESIYGDMRNVGELSYKDEVSFGDLISYLRPGYNTDLSFGIALLKKPGRILNSASIVIGRVIQGMDVVHAINNAFANDRRFWLPDGEVVISNSGQLS